MNADTAIAAGSAVIVAAIGALGIYIRTVLAQVVAARLASEAAERNSKPTSNGWSARTTSALERIEAEQTRQAAEQARQGVEINHLTIRFDNHIDRATRPRE